MLSKILGKRGVMASKKIWLRFSCPKEKLWNCARVQRKKEQEACGKPYDE